MSFIMEQAGGKASAGQLMPVFDCDVRSLRASFEAITGHSRVLDIPPVLRLAEREYVRSGSGKKFFLFVTYENYPERTAHPRQPVVSNCWP